MPCRSGESYAVCWRELSRRVRFERAGGRCQGCGRPHGATVRCLPDGRWYVWLAIKYTVPHMIARNRGGRILITSSVAGMRGEPGMAHYSASKWAVIGLAKSLAQELSAYSITVNTLHPTAVNTDIIKGMAKAANMEVEDLIDFIYTGHALPVKLIEAADVASAALWLASDDARYVTGLMLQVDAGRMLK